MLKKGGEGDAILRTYMLLQSYNNPRRCRLYKNKHPRAYLKNLIKVKRVLSYYILVILRDLI
jgi:hypothetical protein